jgi:molecular chaperone GrpE
MSTDPEQAGANGAADDAPKTPEEPPPGEGDEAAPAEPTPETAPGPEQKAAEALSEVTRLRDQLLRTAADFDNFRKRARRSEDEALRRGREQMLKDLLPVFDNLERAVQHAEGSPEAKAVASGLRMVLKQFVDTLDKAGIKRIAAVGQAFDPTHHEAIQHLESAEHPAGVVMAEVQPGYLMGDNLIRAAMVVVSKGPPASPETASN